MYFENFPLVNYTNIKNGDPKLVTNMLKRIAVREPIKNNAILFTKYTVKNGETPENLAFEIYDDANLHWVILLTNDIYDRYHQWPMSTRQFQAYINDKYTDPNDTHHYEIPQASGDTTVKVNIGQDNTDHPTATIVTNVEYEETEQDKKRRIKLLEPGYVSVFVSSYKQLIKE